MQDQHFINLTVMQGYAKLVLMKNQKIDLISGLFIDLAKGLFLAAFALPILVKTDVLVFIKSFGLALLCVIFALELLNFKEN